MLRGDFKARTGNAVDMTHDNRNQYFLDLTHIEIENDIFNRVSEIPVLKERIRTIKLLYYKPTPYYEWKIFW